MGALLRQVADLVGLQPIAGHDPAAHGLLQAQQRPHQRGFAGAVFSDDAQIIALVHAEIEAIDDDAAFVAEGQVYSAEQSHPRFLLYRSASLRTLRFFSMMER